MFQTQVTLSADRDNLISWDGLNGEDADKRDTYDALILPNDTAEYRLDEGATASACALVTEARFRFLGMTHPYLSVPYQKRQGMVVADVQTIGRALGFWLPTGDPGCDETPEVGDVLLMGGTPATGGEAHYDNIITVLSGTSEYYAIAGGQGNHGAHIATVHRKFVKQYGHLWIQADTGSLRRVTGRMRASDINLVDPLDQGERHGMGKAWTSHHCAVRV